MSDKPEFVDLIKAATPQRRKAPPKRIIAQPEVKQEKRLSNWPPGNLAKWRLETLVAWKLKMKNWEFKNWF